MPKKRISFTKIYVFLLLTITVALGIAFRRDIPDCGIADLSNISDIRPDMVTLNYAWEYRDGMKEMSAESFGPADEGYGVGGSSVIAVVSPTGSICQSEGSIGQEFVIKEIIRGEKIASVGEAGYVFQHFGLHENVGKIEFMNTLNLMNTQNEYLIFMEKSPICQFTGESVYILNSEYFGYIRLWDGTTKTLDKDYKKYDFTELGDYEFFSASDQITEILNEIRTELLDKYYYN